MKPPFYLSLLLALLALPAQAQDRTLVSGVYGFMPVALNRETGIVSGYFIDAIADGKFTCEFYFRGKMEGNTAQIESFYPGDVTDIIPGTLTVNDNELTISLAEEHGGCGNVQHFADKDAPAIFMREDVHPSWKAIRVIKADKAAAHMHADEKSNVLATLEKDEAIGVISESGEWREIKLREDDRHAWVREADLYPLPASVQKRP